MLQQFSELFPVQKPLREPGTMTVMAFWNRQRITGKNSGEKESRKVEKYHYECCFAFLKAQFGEGL